MLRCLWRRKETSTLMLLLPSFLRDSIARKTVHDPACVTAYGGHTPCHQEFTCPNKTLSVVTLRQRHQMDKLRKSDLLPETKPSAERKTFSRPPPFTTGDSWRQSLGYPDPVVNCRRHCGTVELYLENAWHHSSIYWMCMNKRFPQTPISWFALSLVFISTSTFVCNENCLQDILGLCIFPSRFIWVNTEGTF